MSFDYVGRIERLREVMRAQSIDVSLLSVGADLPYFSGYEAMPSERLTVMVIPIEEDPFLLLPRLEAPQADDSPFEVRAWTETEDPVALAAGSLIPDRVAVGDQMWSVFLTRFQEKWAHAEWVPASALTSPLRIRKEPTEIDLLEKAAHAVDRVMARIPDEVRFAGRTERSVAIDLAGMLVGEGHDTAEFTIVASGANGASPHHHPGEKVIAEGDLVICDIGGRMGGYFSDSTRTFVVGESNAKQREVHEVVLEANEAARAAVQSGVICESVDRVARGVIADAGYGDDFIHRTGHGIGLEVHEHPYLVEGNSEPLEPGMTFSVEPGVYLTGSLGVRIEDIVVCHDRTSTTLNQSERGLVSVA